MSEPLKLGDEVEVVKVYFDRNREWIGRRVVVVEVIQNHDAFGDEIVTNPMPKHPRGWLRSQLKRIPPKSDFEKAEDWFIEDLMRTIKRGERV